MASPPLTEKLVYLTLKEIFSGNEIQPSITKKIRKKIRKKIEKYQEDVKIGALIQQYGLEHITGVAIALLEEQIFGSDSKAKARFPDVFEVLPSQDNQPTDFGPKIVEGDAAAVQHIGVYSPEELLSIGARLKIRKKEEQIKAIEADPQTTPAVSESPQQLYTQPKMATQSLDSICLPLWDQHRILVRVQYTLEKACFTFAQKRLGGVLQREGWDCAEAVELNRWPKVLLTYQEECSLNNVQEVDKPLPSLLDSITQLRHNAVHRVRLSSSNLLQHLTDAGLLARLLQDDGCSKFISTIKQRTQDAIEKLVHNKQLLDGKLAEIKKDFAVKRAELERQEAALLEAAVREHREPVVSVSGSLGRLSDDFGSGPDETHAEWGHVYDAALPNDESSGSEGTAEAEMGKEMGDGVVEESEKDIGIVNQLPALPILVPTVDGGLIEPAITREKKEAEKDKDKDPMEGEPCLERLEVVLDRHGSDPKHPSEDPPFNRQGTTAFTLNAVEQGGMKPEAAEACEPDDSDLGERDKEHLCEPDTSPVPTCIKKSEDDANQGHTKSSIRQVIPIENGHMDLEARKEQPAATKGQSYSLTTIHSYQEESWPGAGGIEPLSYDPVWKAVSQAIADKKEVETIVSMQEKVDSAT